MYIRIPSPYCPDCSFSGLRIGTRADEQFSVVAVLALLVCNTVFGAWRSDVIPSRSLRFFIRGRSCYDFPQLASFWRSHFYRKTWLFTSLESIDIKHTFVVDANWTIFQVLIFFALWSIWNVCGSRRYNWTFLRRVFCRLLRFRGHCFSIRSWWSRLDIWIVNSGYK